MARFTHNIHSGYFKERFPNSATCTRTFTSKNDSAANLSALSRQWDPSQNGLFFFSIDLERKAYPERCSSSWKEQRTTAHCSPYRSSLLRTFVYRTLRYLVLVRKLSVLATIHNSKTFSQPYGSSVPVTSQITESYSHSHRMA